MHGQGPRLEAMSLQPAFAFFAVPFPCFDAIPRVRNSQRAGRQGLPSRLRRDAFLQEVAGEYATLDHAQVVTFAVDWWRFGRSAC